MYFFFGRFTCYVIKLILQLLEFYITIWRCLWFYLLGVGLSSSSRWVVPRDRCVDIFLGLIDCGNRGCWGRVNLLFRRRVVFCSLEFLVSCVCLPWSLSLGCRGFVCHCRDTSSVWCRQLLRLWLICFLCVLRDIVFWFMSRRSVLREEFLVHVLRRLRFYEECRDSRRWRCGGGTLTVRGRLLRWCWSRGTLGDWIYIFFRIRHK